MGILKKHFILFKDQIFHIADDIISWIKEYRTLFLIYLGIGCIVFFMLISQNLVNSYDGLWNNSSFFAGRWEWSLGRWFWPYLDKLRFGIVSISLNSFVTLIMVASGNVLLVDLFQVKHKLPAVLTGALFIATPLICDSLSYCFMSVTFGLAFLLGVFSAYCAIKIPRKLIAIIVAALLMAWSMGNYQAYFGVTCIVLLIYFIRVLFQDVDKKTVCNMILRATGTVVIGGLFYKCVVTVVNAVNHVELSSYKGASNISVKSIIINLPQRIPEAFNEFFEFYFTNIRQKTIFHLKWVYLVAFLLTACILLFKLIAILQQNLLNGILCILAILVIPIACNATIILTNDPNTILMTGGTTLLFSLFLCLFDEVMDRRLLYSGYLCILIVMLWVNICIVTNDQLSMREGKITTVTLAQNIITRLSYEGYISTDNKFAFVGKPSASNMFVRTTAFNNANSYAKFGDWWTKADCNRYSWNGLFTGYCGVKFNFCVDSQYEELIRTDEVREMPCFPEQGSIREIDDIIVVKVSDSF